MILMDTDTLTLYFQRHPRVSEKVRTAEEVPATSIVTRIEVLQGRFESVLKAANADQLLAAQERLAVAEIEMAKFEIVPFDALAAAEFDRLRQNRKLKKIGRKDLLIATIALAHSATLVTRNLRDFRQIPSLRLENWAD
jgi:tRNA(fMet)-specific endonuclease VapC